MTLHYAPTTLEEEELALALALSASLNSSGAESCEPVRSSASVSSQSSRDSSGPSSRGAPSRGPSSRGASFSGRPEESDPRPPRDLSTNFSLSLNPSLIYPQLPPPPAVRLPNPATAGRPAPSHSSSASALHPPSAPSQPTARPRHASSVSPTRVSRWPHNSSGPGSPSSGSRWPHNSSGPGSPSSGAAAAAAAVRRPFSPSRPARTQPAQQPPPQPRPPPPPPVLPPPPQPAQRPAQPGAAAHLPPILPTVGRGNSANGPSGTQGSGSGGGCGSGPCSSSGSRSNGCSSAGPSTSSGCGVVPLAPPPALPVAAPLQLFSDPEACAGCGRGFGVFSRSYITGLGRKWHGGCFRCGFCHEPISNGRGTFSYQMHPTDPHPYHPECYVHVHHPLCHVCGNYITANSEGVISYRENGFWRERYCPAHSEAELTRCCACSRLQKLGEEWAPLPDGRPLCLHCLSSVVLDTPDAQPLYDEVLTFYKNEMRLPHAYKPPLLLVDGATLNTYAAAEGRDDSAGAPVFHLRGLCVATIYTHIPAILRGAGNTIRSVSTELPPTGSGRGSFGGSGASRVHCHVKVLLLLYGLPRLLSGCIMAHELMHAWLRMEGVVGLPIKVEEGLCQLMACLWLDRQHELLRGKPEEQRLASFFSYQIRTDMSEVYGEGFREALEAFQTLGLTTLIKNVKMYGHYTAP